MDRFSSHEEIEWAKGPFDDGAEARILGCGLDQCPSEDHVGNFAMRSWKAGWADADAQIHADGGPEFPLTPEPKVGESGLSDEQFVKQVHPQAQDWRGWGEDGPIAIWNGLRGESEQLSGHFKTAEEAWADARALIEAKPPYGVEAKPEPLPNTQGRQEKSLVETINSLWTGKELLPCGCPASSEYIYYNSETGHAHCVKCGDAYRHHSQIAAPKVVDSKEYICTDPECFGDCHPIRKAKAEEPTPQLGTCADFPNTPHPMGTCESCDMRSPLAESVAPPSLPKQQIDFPKWYREFFEKHPALHHDAYIPDILKAFWDDHCRAAAPVALPNLECGDEEHLDPAIKLLADVMHLWVDGYISKNPKSMAPDSISSDVFEAVERLLSMHEIAVDYCGWHIEPVALPTHQVVRRAAGSSAEGVGYAELRCSCGRIFVGLGDEALASSRASFEAHLPEKEGK